MNQKPPVKSYCGGKPNYCEPYLDDAKPLYSAQREWVGLTREDIQAAFDTMTKWGDYAVFAQALEAKLKEKNN